MEAVLTRHRGAEHGLDDLVLVAGRLLASCSLRQRDGRVAEMPDVRGVRYYQTLGLIDKPFRYDGRQAVYGYRHLLQLVAVKLLQAEGLSLAQVQRALTGLSDARLEAAVSDALSRPDPGRPDGGEHGSDIVLHDNTPSPATWPVVAPHDGDRATRVARHDGGATARAPGSPEAVEDAATTGPTARALVAAEVAPGVVVTVDPDVVATPHAVLELIERSLRDLT